MAGRTGAVTAFAGAMLVAEGLALLGIAGWQTVALAGGDTSWVDSSIALIVLTLIGAIAVTAFGVAVLRGRSWGRSGGIVTQLLILAVAGGALTGAYADPSIAVALAIPAVIVLVLLVLVARAASQTAPQSPDS